MNNSSWQGRGWAFQLWVVTIAQLVEMGVSAKEVFAFSSFIEGKAEADFHRLITIKGRPNMFWLRFTSYFFIRFLPIYNQRLSKLSECSIF